MHKMLFKFVSYSFALLLLTLVSVNAQENGELPKEVERKMDRTTSLSFPDLMNVLFLPNQIREGNIRPFYFGGAFSTKYPHFLLKENADKIPFTTHQLPNILERFGFSQGSKPAVAVNFTLRFCEAKPLPGVIQFCATSLESMVENVRKRVGPNTKPVKVLSTSPLPKSTPKLQNYKVMSKPKEVVGSENMLGCHLLTYPYAVYFCHRPAGANKVFEVELMGEDGTKINAIAACHFYTSNWDKNLDAWRFLGIQPGEPICHVLPRNDLVWVPRNVDDVVEASSTPHVM